MMVVLKYISQSICYVETDASVAQEISDHFAFFVNGYQWMPKYKAGVWDGKIRLFNVKTGELQLGLVKDLARFCKDKNYKLSFDENVKKCFRPIKLDIDAYLESYNLPFEPKSYQKAIVKEIVNYRRALFLSATSSGKSFAIYLAIRILLESEQAKKVLLVVPTVALVTQMIGDFKEYSDPKEFDVDEHCHGIYSGKEKHNRSNITISTFQSLIPLIKEGNEEFFKPFELVIIDEAHTSTSSSIVSILNACINAKFRAGLTGTIKDSKTNVMQLTGLFGPVREVISTKELIDLGITVKLKINVILLKYVDKVKQMVSQFDYVNEIDFLVNNKQRNEFICNLANNIEGNTLILFTLVEKQGKPLAKMLKEITEHKQVFFVDGSTKPHIVDAIKSKAETEDNIVIVSSYKKFSTGLSIKRLANLIFASPMKSRITIFQSIGRVLRKNKFSNEATVYDIADDFSIKKDGVNKLNTTLKHLKARLAMYKEAKLDYNVIHEHNQKEKINE